MMKLGDMLASNSIRVNPGVILRIIGSVVSRADSNSAANTNASGDRSPSLGTFVRTKKSFKFNADVAQLVEAIGLDPIQ